MALRDERPLTSTSGVILTKSPRTIQSKPRPSSLEGENTQEETKEVTGMPNPAKQKGDRLERAVTHLFNAQNIKAEKVPLSGAVANYPGDANIWIDGKKWILECKSRKEFKTLYGWLENRDALILKGDRQPALICLPLDSFLKLIADQSKHDDARGEA